MSERDAEAKESTECSRHKLKTELLEHRVDAIWC